MEKGNQDKGVGAGVFFIFWGQGRELYVRSLVKAREGGREGGREGV